MPKLRLMTDFPDHVLWAERGGPIPPEKLGLSPELCEALYDWYCLWSRIENDNEYKVDATAKLDWWFFDTKGIGLWKRVSAELSGQYDVVFYSHRLGAYFETPAELEEVLRSGLENVTF